MLERETCRPLKTIRTDNGRDYISKEFEEYYRKHGILHEKTEPDRPQRNGVVERMNRNIVEKVSSILRMSKLPKAL